MNSQIAQILFLSHGGGPLPLMGERNHLAMLNACRRIKSLLKPVKRIVIVSAHWQAEGIQINAAETPAMLYDYYGFPSEAYQYKYSVTGDTELANKISDELNKQGLGGQLELGRGIDHGVFVPLMLLFPEAQIPIVQISLDQNLAAQTHLKLGECLKSCLDADTLLIGSGASFHNLAVFRNAMPEDKARVTRFHDKLDESVLNDNLESLSQWQNMPGANFSHPQAEHLMPLHVCAAAGQGLKKSLIPYDLFNWPARAYLWSQPV